MAFNLQEQEIIKAGVAGGKTRQEVESALNRYRSGQGPIVKEEPKPEITERVGTMLAERAGKIGEAQTRQEQGKQSSIETAFQAFGHGLGAAGETAFETVRAVPILGGVIDKVIEVGIAGAKQIVESNPQFKKDIETATEAYKNLDDRTKANLGAFGEVLSAFLGGAGGKAGTKIGIKTSEKIIEEGIETGVKIAAKGRSVVDDAFNSARKLKDDVQVYLAEKNVDPKLKASVERLQEPLYLQGTKRLENPVSTYDKMFEQSNKSKVDIKIDSPIEGVGSEMGDAFNVVIAQRKAVGAKMGEELKKVGNVKTDIADSFTSFETALKESDLTFDATKGKLVAGNTSKMAAEDISLIEDYVKELNKLGTNPTIAEIDGLIGRTTAKISYDKSAKGIVETTNSERLVKGSLAKLREAFDPKKTGNEALTEYANARKAYSDLSDFIDDGAGYLGKITQSGDFAKDASIAKSAVQSVLNSGKKDWLIQLEALTGYPALDMSVLALQAMKDAGIAKGQSLLQLMSEGAVPTSKAGFTQAVIDFAVKQGTIAVAGTPEEQTRAFLTSLSQKASQKP